MSFDLVRETAQNPELTAWVEQMKARLDAKMAWGVKKALEVDDMPYSSENGQWKKTSIGWNRSQSEKMNCTIPTTGGDCGSYRPCSCCRWSALPANFPAFPA